MILSAFIWFCLSQNLITSLDINYQSHLGHKYYDTNHVDVCCNMIKTLYTSKVAYFNISPSHIVSHNLRDQSRWIPLLTLAVRLTISLLNYSMWPSIWVTKRIIKCYSYLSSNFYHLHNLYLLQNKHWIS